MSILCTVKPFPESLKSLKTLLLDLTRFDPVHASAGELHSHEHEDDSEEMFIMARLKDPEVTLLSAEVEEELGGDGGGGGGILDDTSSSKVVVGVPVRPPITGAQVRSRRR